MEPISSKRSLRDCRVVLKMHWAVAIHTAQPARNGLIFSVVLEVLAVKVLSHVSNAVKCLDAIPQSQAFVANANDTLGWPNRVPLAHAYLSFPR